MADVDAFGHHYGWTIKDVLSLTREEHAAISSALSDRLEREARALKK